MKIRYNVILVTLLTATRFIVAAENPVLQVSLPSEIAIKGTVILLENIGKLSGDETLTAKAGKVTLGRLLTPQQQVTVDRPMILSRLACNGIPPSQIVFSGDEKVTVKQQQQIIKGAEFVELADAFRRKMLRRLRTANGTLCECRKILSYLQ